MEHISRRCCDLLCARQQVHEIQEHPLDDAGIVWRERTAQSVKTFDSDLPLKA